MLSSKHIPFLDQIRGVAILLVFLFHCQWATFGVAALPWDGWWRSFHTTPSLLALLPVTLGWSGVAVFFALSGFCIHIAHLQSRRSDWSTFLIRRFCRIYPPYLVALILILLLGTMVPPVATIFSPYLGQVASHLALLHNFRAVYFFGINPSFWSIAVEVQLYLLYPLLLLGCRRMGWQILWVPGLIEMLLRGIQGIAVTLGHDDFLPVGLTGSPLYYWFSWAVGMRLADDYIHDRPLFLSRVPSWLWAGLFVMCYLLRPLSEYQFPIASLATTSLIACLLTRSSTSLPLPTLIRRHLECVGVFSYSIYLLHQPLLAAVPWLFGHAFATRVFHPLVPFFICVAAWPAVLAIASVFNRVIERPSIHFGKWLIQQRESAVFQKSSNHQDKPVDSPDTAARTPVSLY